MVNLSVLGINANNSAIENVDVNRFVFILSGNGTLSGNVNASGLVANLTNSQIVDSNATVTFNFNLTFTSQVNVGGMCITMLVTMAISLIVLFTLYSSIRSYGTEKLYTTYQELLGKSSNLYQIYRQP